MIDAMPRPRPPHLHRETSRHGKPIWYVRVGKGPRIRIRAEYGTDDFNAEYRDALDGKTSTKRNEAATGTLAWLVARYRETTEWSLLSNATRRQRENILKHVLASGGHQPFGLIGTTEILKGIDRRKDTPFQAEHFLVTMRGVFRWAKKAQHIKTDPTAGVTMPARPKSGGYLPWTESMVDAYELRWPIGTRQRVWLDVLLYTGLRRGDAVRFGRQHVRDGIGTMKTEKSGHTIEVTLPILPVLQRTLDHGPCGDMTFICGERGQPMSKESFGNEFRVACNKAGVPGSAHGVRKIAATRAANAGATVAQLQAIFGWTDIKMPSLYTQTADRRRLAREAMHKLANDTATSIPSPDHKVRARKEKDQ